MVIIYVQSLSAYLNPFFVASKGCSSLSFGKSKKISGGKQQRRAYCCEFIDQNWGPTGTYLCIFFTYLNSSTWGGSLSSICTAGFSCFPPPSAASQVYQKATHEGQGPLQGNGGCKGTGKWLKSAHISMYK